jgi:hypothetical protein
VNYPLYRRLCSIEDDGANAEDGFDAPKTLRIYTQLENRQYLYEDALSADADNFGINFLGYENIDQHPEEQLSDGRYKFNYNLFIDTAFINRGTGWIKPQYLIAVDVEEVGERTVQRTDDCDEPYDEKIPAYKKGRYLINATDSARKIASNGSHTYEIRDERYITSSSWDRLAFVDAIHVDDRLYIVSELQRRGIKEADYMEEEDGKLYVNGLKLREKTVGMARTPQNSGVYGAYYDFAEWNNYHNDVSFSLRFVDPKAANASEKTGLGGTDNDSKRFLIESETTNRNPYGGRKIAPVQGGWVRLVNLVPALSRSSYEDAIQQADIFNVEPGTGKATDNEAVSTVSPVKIIAGTNEVTVLNASGKKLSIENILGQTVNTITLSSDNQTVKAPAGVVVVTVEGEKSAKLFVK